MLHHLPGSVPHDYAGPTQVIEEVYRILKEEGAFIINTLTQEQMLKCFFMYQLVPQASQHVNQK